MGTLCVRNEGMLSQMSPMFNNFFDDDWLKRIQRSVKKLRYGKAAQRTRVKDDSRYPSEFWS